MVRRNEEGIKVGGCRNDWTETVDALERGASMIEVVPVGFNRTLDDSKRMIGLKMKVLSNAGCYVGWNVAFGMIETVTLDR
jgi:hypothetical protein